MDLHENSESTDSYILEECGDKIHSTEFWEGVLFPDRNLDYDKPQKQKKSIRINYKAYISKGSTLFSIREDFPSDVSKDFVVSYFSRQAREFGGRVIRVVKIKVRK